LISRRAFLGAAAALAVAGAARAGRADAEAQLGAIETRLGGRLGVMVVDTGNGAVHAHRADERFPLCSTFKMLAAAAILRRVDEGAERLDRRIAYRAADLLDYAPIAKRHAAEGAMSLEALCAAAVTVSDNTAGNLLLRVLGRPSGVTAFARALDDTVTRLDRTEPTLNSAIAGDPRDTTSPRAMVHDLRRLLLEDVLAPASRARLEGWMVAARTGSKRLRAGLPASWQVGDKTGSGANGTANVVAIVRPPARAPLLAAVYMTGTTATDAARDAAHAEIGRLISGRIMSDGGR
jgi:beta-lactamase class A